MSTIDDGGPAFREGMSLRDWFASQVIPQLIKGWSPEKAAHHAYEYADAMIAERAKGAA